VCSRWINILVPTKQVMEEFHTLMLKTRFDTPIKVKIVVNLKHLVDVKVLLGLSCVFSLLEVVHNLIKF
jgi:hypothetical protein